MPKRTILPIILFSLLTASFSFADWFPGASPVSAEFIKSEHLKVTMLSNYESEINLQFPGLEFDEQAFEVLSVKGLDNVGGAPAVSGFLNMPASSDIVVEVLSSKNKTYQIDNPALIQLCNELTQIDGIKFDSGTISYGIPGIFRDLRIVPINIRPFDFNPVTKELSVTSEVTFHVSFSEGNAINPKTYGYKNSSAAFKKLYNQLCWNYVDNGTDDFEQSYYLVICPDFYADLLQPFVTWKNQKGVQTSLVTFSEINPSGVQDYIIKNYLTFVYTSSENPPDYVLLVGDESNFPIHMSYTSDPPTPFSFASYPGNYIDDNYFACLEGDDYYPDLILGRFVLHQEENVVKIVNKVVNYEKNPNMTQTGWYDKAIVCADLEDPTQRTTKLTVRDMMLEQGGFTSVDSLFGGSQPALFLSWVNNGRSFINYRGTGWSQGWAGLNIYVGDLSNLNNNNKLSIVTGIGCGVAEFSQSTPCFGETWMNSGTVSSPSGAVAFFGPTWNTHTQYNNALDIGIYEALFPDSMRNMGASIVAGKMYVESQFAPYIQAYSSVEEVVKTLFCQYILLSDPELLTRAAIPMTIIVEHPDSVSLGQSTLDISVEDESGNPVVGATVCAYIEGEVFSVDLTDALGEVHLPVNPQTRPGNLQITVTGIDIDTYSAPLPVYASEEFVSLTDFEIQDIGVGDNLLSPGETVDLSALAENFGIDQANDVFAILSAEVEGVEFETDSVFFGNISPEEEIWGETPFRFTLSSDYESSVLPMTIHFSDEEAHSWSSPLEIEVYSPMLVFTGYNVDPGPDSVLERGGQADLTVLVQNIGAIDVADMIGTLESLDPEVIIIDGETQFGEIIQGTLVENSGDPFIFLVDGTCPSNFTAHFRFTLSGDQGTFNYQMVNEFDLIVGEPTVFDPGSDSQGLYFAYESRDVTYLQAPDYNWVEISPQVGGAGTEITFNESTGTTYLNLPFNWVFYGEEFSMIIVTEDGFITPNPLSSTLSINWGFPRLDQANGMVAPLWDDLKCTVFEPGDVSYLHDPLTGAFRIEYHEWTHSATNVYPETFQVVIYDPEVRVTQSGNSEIEFIYGDLTGLGIYFSSCGIESPDQSDGIEIWQNSQVPPTSWAPASNTSILITTESPVFLNVEDIDPGKLLPESVYLENNYPNPFNPSTSFKFGLPEKSEVHLSIYNIMGRRVAALIDGYSDAGIHQVEWNAAGNASGIYFARLTAGGKNFTVKCLLIK